VARTPIRIERVVRGTNNTLVIFGSNWCSLDYLATFFLVCLLDVSKSSTRQQVIDSNLEWKYTPYLRTHKYLFIIGITMYKQTSFLITGAILVAAIVTVVLYNVNVANAQANMTAGAGKLANMTAGGGNMTKANMTAGPIRSAISNATK
jgi:hypothetical protein